MQQKQEETLNDIQSKLYVMNQVKEDLKATNDFQPKIYLYSIKKKRLLYLV
jgi:hypothetical protein